MSGHIPRVPFSSQSLWDVTFGDGTLSLLGRQAYLPLVDRWETTFFLAGLKTVNPSDPRQLFWQHTVQDNAI